ncbi:VOC family protein [Ottowia thiooxydans]|uniref:VOC family protein n=1 Tax=Ottowia thiooxydans TaxID=219182 RepID=UPI000424362F|nr:VOC family protein [Ottowia thiooxydans]
MTRLLDHIGVAFADLDHGQTVFKRLGFTLTPRSLHYGQFSPDEPVQLWGSGNHLAVFHEGFVEAIGITDPTGPSRVKHMVAKHAGAHIVALGGEKAETQFADIRTFGDFSTEVCSLQREAPFGPNNEEVRPVAFKNIYIDEEVFPEAHFLLIEHVTPEVLWQPHHLIHANGALSLQAVYFAAKDPSALAAKLKPLFYDKAVRSEDAVQLKLDRGSAWIFTPDAWNTKAPGSYVPPLPAPVGYQIGVKSLGETRKYLESQGFVVHETSSAVSANDVPPGLWISAEDAGGAAVHFVQEPKK